MLNSYPHLTLRNHTYYARFYVPKHLVEIAKRKNFFYSLFTKDYYEALHKVKEYAYKTDLLVQSYERKYQEMLKLKHKYLKDADGKPVIRLCLTYTEVQHIFVQWWCEVLNKVARYENEIKSGKKTFKDFCFYHPARLTDIERIVDVEYETADGETIFETLTKQDVYDGYKIRTIEEERVANPSVDEKNNQLYDYILKVLKKDIANRNVDRELVDILQDNPNAILYVFNKDDYEIVGNNDEDLQDVLERHKGDEDYDIGYMMFSLAELANKMRESEELLLNYLEHIRTGTTYNTPLYFKKIINTAEHINENHLENIAVKSPIFDYKKYLKMWEKEQKLRNISPRSIAAHKNTLMLMFEILEYKGVDKLHKHDLEELEKNLKLLPKNYKQKFGNQPVLEVIKKYADKASVQKISDPTVRDYFKLFNTFANFLLQEDIIYSNPFSRYKIRYAKEKKQSYEHFTDDELAKIFDYKTYPKYVVKDTPTLHPELFWIPILGLYLGCRLNELCQLDVADIQKHSGIYCLQIFPDDRETALKKKEVKQTKTKNKRIVPIPQKILDLGFLEYVRDRKKHKHKKLFELKYNKDNKYTKAVSRWFAKYLDSIGISSATKVFHSFRHNLVQNMKMLGYVDSYAMEIGGWSKNDGRAYSSYNNGAIPLERLKYALDQLEFPMIDWEKLKVRPTDTPKKREYHRSKTKRKTKSSKN